MISTDDWNYNLVQKQVSEKMRLYKVVNVLISQLFWKRIAGLKCRDACILSDRAS